MPNLQLAIRLEAGYNVWKLDNRGGRMAYLQALWKALQCV